MARPKTKMRRQREIAPGQDGHVDFKADVQISHLRTEPRSMRARPGTFEWRYNRQGKGKDKPNSALLLAGSHFAILWERAGATVASSSNLDKQGGGDWKGLPDGRVTAMDELRGAMKQLGITCTARLTDYCVRGLTAAEIAKNHNAGEREMATVLEHDLKDCASYFHFIGKRAA